MQVTLLSSKGQVILPKALRDAHHWQAGTRLEVLDTADGVLLKPVVVRQATALSPGLEAIRRRLDYHGPAVSLEDMNAAVLQEAKNRNQN
jgi:AbrB family looped-hinge helix DNA binding protein